MNLCRSAWGTLASFAFDYDTPKIVRIQNKKVGALYRLFQLGIMGFMIGYSIIYSKGYQDKDNVFGGSHYENCQGSTGAQVYDPADYVVPPQEPNSFFVMTNMWVTCDQSYGFCGEDPSVQGSNCTGPSDCVKQNTIKGNGPRTGVCNNETHTCEVYAWCPTEKENVSYTDMGPKINAEGFTVLIKNSIQFPNLAPNTLRKNYISNYDLSKCGIWSHDNYYCPIFQLEDIVAMIDPPQNFTELATQGAVVVLTIAWNCDLDRSGCDPVYGARRLDTSAGDSTSGGFNFRFAKYWYEQGIQYRTLIKAYGILFVVELVGQGGKFSITTLVLKLGSTVALLGIAAVLSDVVVLYVVRKHDMYYGRKYLMVKEYDQEQGEGGEEEKVPFLQHEAAVLSDMVVLYIVQKRHLYYQEKYQVVKRLASFLAIHQSFPKAVVVAEIYGRLNVVLVRSIARAILARELPPS
ncbi:hypothetical protein EMCRGX_G012507 [Ephydatia muelleri]